MNDCIGIGKLLGHKFEVRVERHVSRFGSEEPLNLAQLLKDNPVLGTDLSAVTELVAAKQGWMDQSHYIADVCVRCGKVVRAVERPLPPLPPPPAGVADIPCSPQGLTAKVIVGQIRK